MLRGVINGPAPSRFAIVLSVSGAPMKWGLFVLFLIFHESGWPQNLAGPELIQKKIETTIRQDLAFRAQRLDCRVAEIRVEFLNIRRNESGDQELEYQVSYKETYKPEVTNTQVVRKRVVFNKDGSIQSLMPLAQRVQFQDTTSQE